MGSTLDFGVLSKGLKTYPVVARGKPSEYSMVQKGGI